MSVMNMITGLNLAYTRGFVTATLVAIGLLLLEFIAKSFGLMGVAYGIFFFIPLVGLFALAQPFALALAGAFGSDTFKGNIANWFTVVVPTVLFWMLILPFCILYLPVEQYTGVAIAGLVFWIMAATSARADGVDYAWVFRIPFICIMLYLGMAGLWGSSWGQRIVSESPSLQYVFELWNPFKSGTAQKDLEWLAQESNRAREEKMHMCIKYEGKKAAANGSISDQRVIKNIKATCEQRAGYESSKSEPLGIPFKGTEGGSGDVTDDDLDLYTLTSSKEKCHVRNVYKHRDRINTDIGAVRAILTGCDKDPNFTL